MTGDGALVEPEADLPEAWPHFRYRRELTDRGTMTCNPTGEYIFPSIFHAGAHLTDPLAEWYLYFAPHEKPGGVLLMYAEHLEGPWSEFAGNPIVSNNWPPHYSVSHVSSPDAIWNEEAGRVFLYFHGENSTTRCASSIDGVRFDYEGVAVSNEMAGAEVTESSYARVFRHPDPACGYGYAMFFMGNERDDVRRIRLAESVDGITWTVDPGYVVVPGPAEGGAVCAADLWEWRGKRYVVYHGEHSSFARTIDITLRHVGARAIPLRITAAAGAELGRVASPEIVSYGERSHLFFESGDRLRATIAWAEADLHPEATSPRTGTDGGVR